jgi:hypothetical protein
MTMVNYIDAMPEHLYKSEICTYINDFLVHSLSRDGWFVF